MTQADMLIETDALEQVRTIPINPSFQYMRLPRIYDPHLMPPDVARILRRRWNLSKHVIPPVAFHVARDVYVVEEGLVFTGDGHLVAASQADVPAHEIVRARATLQASLAQPASIPSHPRAILCKKRGAGNYGHWLAEMLPRAYVARQYLPDRDWPVVIHAVEGTLRTVMRESLHAVGITENRIIESGGAPVYFAELLVPSGLTAHAVFLSPLVMECMDFIADQVPPPISTPCTYQGHRRPPVILKMKPQSGPSLNSTDTPRSRAAPCPLWNRWRCSVPRAVWWGRWGRG